MNTKPQAVAHTPTPWKLGFEEYIWDEASNPPQKRRATRIDADQHVSIAFVATDIHPNHEGEANAELIIRAVNSHAALVSALNNLLDYADRHEDDAGYQAAMREAESALALADGTKEQTL